jgi:hypothetical protein
VSKIISVFSGNRMRLGGLDGVATSELIRLQEDVSAAAPVAPMSCKNPRRFIKYLPCPRCSEAAGQLPAPRKSNASRAPARRTAHRLFGVLSDRFADKVIDG